MITIRLTEEEYDQLLYNIGVRTPTRPQVVQYSQEVWSSAIGRILQASGNSIAKPKDKDLWDTIKEYGRG